MSNKGYTTIEFDEDEDGDIGSSNAPPRLDFQNFGTSAGSGQGYAHPDATQTNPNAGFWTIEAYQPLFDVDTATVLERCWKTVLPKGNWLEETVGGEDKMDLYGPFWSLTTLAFVIFVFSSLASSITSYLSGSTYEYNFTALSIAVTLVYVYGLALPLVLWGAGRWMGIGWNWLSLVGIWGYGMTIWIPIAALCIIPVSILRWALVGIAAVSSGWFIIRHLYPHLAQSDHPSSRFLLIIIGALHLAVALTLKIAFFSYSVGGKTLGPDEPLPGATQ